MQTLEDDDAVLEFLEDSGSNNGTTTDSNANGNGQELVSKRMIKEEKFCNTFGLSLSEKVLKSFPCFLVAEILIQGTMVVTERHICFYSNIPGLKRNIKIRFADIVRLTKEKVYAFFPTGIGVHSRREKTVFSYVTSRDKLLQLLRSHWESYSEVDEDFGSSVRGSSVDEAPMDGQTSSRDASVLNDEDSGILVAPTVTASTAGSVDSSQLEEDCAADVDSRSADTNGDCPRPGTRMPAAATAAAAAPAAMASWSQRWKLLLLDWDRLPNRHVISFVAFLVLLCAIVIVYLSYRLNSLQQQLLFIVSMRSGQGQSEVDHLNHRLGGIVETLGGLQEKLGNLRHLLHSLHPVDNQQ